MWVSFFASKLFRDRGSIPPNIGNNIFIGHNQIITKNSISSILVISNFSDTTPTGFLGLLTSHMKQYAKGVRVDVTIKTEFYKFDEDDKGLKGRMFQWKLVLDSPRPAAMSKQRAARLLYTVDILSSGKRGFHSTFYVILRAENYGILSIGIKELKRFVNDPKYKCSVKELKGDLRLHADYSLLVSNNKQERLLDFPKHVFSSRTLSEILPTTQGLNDKDGIFFGFDLMNNSPYFIDMKNRPEGKNILVVSPSGRGKTFSTIFRAQDAHNSNGFNLCITDLKGNEFDSLTKSLNGVSISLRESDTYYINPFKLTDNLTNYLNSDEVFNIKTSLAREYLTIIFDATEKDISNCEILVADFLQNVYTLLGVVPSNKNSWFRADKLNPYVIAEYFYQFMGAQQIARFGQFAFDSISKMRTYMDKTSSRSLIWKNELLIDNIIQSSCITFDYGMLNSERSYSKTVFKLKFAQADYIKDVYIAYKKNNREWTYIINEEAQLAEDYVSKSYKKDVTVRRAQNCVVEVLCNSVSSLRDIPNFRSILNNMRVLLIGDVTDSDKEFLIKEYDLNQYSKVLSNISNSSKYSKSFLLINKLQPDAPTPIIQVFLPENVAKGSLFKTVDVTK